MIVEIILIFVTLIQVRSYKVDASKQNIKEVKFTVDLLSKTR